MIQKGKRNQEEIQPKPLVLNDVLKHYSELEQ